MSEPNVEKRPNPESNSCFDRKSQPYFSWPAGCNPVCLNGKGFVSSINDNTPLEEIGDFSEETMEWLEELKANTKKMMQEQIVCRHLSAYFAITSLKSEVGKFDLSLYKSVESINAAIPLTIEADYAALKVNAVRYNLINNDCFGQHISACFEDMQKPEKQETLRVILMESINHAMVLRLRIKGANENLLYVASLYDPNLTNAIVRCENKQLRTFENYSLKDFLHGVHAKKAERYEAYYDSVEPITLLMECHLAISKEDVIKKPMVLEKFSPDRLTPTHTYLILAGNFADDLVGLQSYFQTIKTNELIILLAAKSGKKTPGLYVAMQNGHSEIVQAFGELLNLIPEEDSRADLLAAENEMGVPALAIALFTGETKAIKTFGALVNQIIHEEKKRIELFAARDQAGTPGLCLAFRPKKVKAIEAYIELLAQIQDEHQRVELVLAINKYGKSELFEALSKGNAELLPVCVKLLNLIPNKERYFELIAEKDKYLAAGIDDALRSKNVEAIPIYVELLGQIQDEDKRAELILAKDPSYMPALQVALITGDITAIQSYGKLLKSITKEDKRAQLIAARDDHGIPAVFFGNAVSIKAFKELLQLLSPTGLLKLANLLTLEDDESFLMFYMPKFVKDVEATLAYQELIKWFPEEVQGKLLDLIAVTSAESTFEFDDDKQRQPIQVTRAELGS